MEFEEAVESAPPGWRHFTISDIARLPTAVRRHELDRVPPGESGERLVRALFWTLVYHLEPEKWEELSRHEHVVPALIEALPTDVEVAVDVGAGSGRLTQYLMTRSKRVVAVEPSHGLGRALARTLAGASVVAGWAESIPLRDQCAQLTTACGAFGPDPVVLAELHRITAPGGVIALISPEDPDWFEAQGWRRVSAPPRAAPDHPAWLDEFFGPLDPPHELVMTRV